MFMCCGCEFMYFGVFGGVYYCVIVYCIGVICCEVVEYLLCLGYICWCVLGEGGEVLE